MSIRLENISKSFESNYALNNIDLTLEKGKTTVLIGPSGCGKSTTIRIITGLIKPDSGKVFFNDKELSEDNLIQVRRKIGYVIQEGGLFPHLNAENNATLLAKHIGWQNEKIQNRVNELCELTSFPINGLNRFPSKLSGGQNQRVSLMRALMLDPEFLLLDEPLGSLDPLIRYDLQTDLKNIFNKLNKTVVLVTHDLSEAAFFADKIILMKDGEIIQTGNIGELINNPQNDFVKKFVTAQRSLKEFN